MVKQDNFLRPNRLFIRAPMIFFTKRVVFSDVAANGSDLFIDNDDSGNKTLEVREGASALSFLSSSTLVAAAQRFLKLSWMLLSPYSNCHGKGHLWSETLLYLIDRSCAWGLLAPVETWRCRN